MKIYTFTLLCFICFILSGCNTFLSKAENLSSNEESIVIKNESTHIAGAQKTKEEIVHIQEGKIEVIRGQGIDEQIVSPIGESKTYFEHYGDMKVKVQLINTGTKSFVYKIRNLEDSRIIDTGILKKNDSVEQVYDQLLEGLYSISTVVQEEEIPVDIALSVKVNFVAFE